MRNEGKSRIVNLNLPLWKMKPVCPHAQKPRAEEKEERKKTGQEKGEKKEKGKRKKKKKKKKKKRKALDPRAARVLVHEYKNTYENSKAKLQEEDWR